MKEISREDFRVWKDLLKPLWKDFLKRFRDTRRDRRAVITIFVLIFILTMGFMQTGWYGEAKPEGVVINRIGRGAVVMRGQKEEVVVLNMRTNGKEVSRRLLMKRVVEPLDFNLTLWSLWVKDREELIPIQFYSTDREALINDGIRRAGGWRFLTN